MARAALSAPGRIIRASDIEFLNVNRRPASTPARLALPTLREAECAHVHRVLEAVSWNKKEAARMLAISRGTLYRKILEYGLSPNIRVSRNETTRW